MFKKKVVSLALVITILLLSILGCTSPQAQKQEENVLEQEWKEVIASAKGTEVNFYMWGGSRTINQWVKGYVAKNLKEKYDLTLNMVPMDATDFVNKLLGEKQIGKKEGTIDLLWINGENFKTAMDNELLFGPFADSLPNYNRYMDTDSKQITTDFGFPTKGYEAPYSKAQFIFIYDQNKIEEAPYSFEELIAWIKSHPGKFTYPALPDFTGSAFVRHVIYEVTGGYEQYYNLEDEAEIRKKIRPALEFLADLEPYLWREGETYPSTIAQLDNMFADGEVLMSMGYDPSKATSEIVKGTYPDSARTFVLESGTISNTNFLAIPFNSPNKAGALVVANFLESFEAQLSKYSPENWGALPVFSYDKLNVQEKEELADLDLGVATLSQEVLDKHSVPELPADLVPIIEDEWNKIVGK
ncbi:ABC transporter substrate-binding protein [Orenia marismortui]|uniref:ABC transporter substrate-binding protein n=1 Tax=Orenia marismortui TaxID=46469 RepID=UPI0003681F62|nr:ABC transporter substrate-binding protein [Orenia marismortui]